MYVAQCNPNKTLDSRTTSWSYKDVRQYQATWKATSEASSFEQAEEIKAKQDMKDASLQGLLSAN